MKAKKILAGLLAMGTIALLTTGCSDSGTDFGKTSGSDTLSGKITMSGSTSMEELVNLLGEGFTDLYPNVSVEVQGGGSSVGITNAKDGVTDIGNASRALKDTETAYGLTEYVIAKDGIAVIVNANSKVPALRLEQVAAIFKGEITNWKFLGGDDAEIVVVGREAGSGTRDAFEEIVGISDEAVYTVEASETGIVKEKVKSEPYGIGYISLGSLDDTVNAIQVDHITPTEDTVKDGTYPIQRPFLCLTTGSESELVKAFLDYIFADGQKVVSKHGFVSVS